MESYQLIHSTFVVWCSPILSPLSNQNKIITLFTLMWLEYLRYCELGSFFEFIILNNKPENLGNGFLVFVQPVPFSSQNKLIEVMVCMYFTGKYLVDTDVAVKCISCHISCVLLTAFYWHYKHRLNRVESRDYFFAFTLLTPSSSNAAHHGECV